MPPLLEQIVAGVRATIPELRVKSKELERRAASAPVPPSFRSALTQGSDVALIAEVKRRSPSAGAISADLDPARHAAKYAASGAAAISVLTEQAHFGGAIDDLVAVCAEVRVPLLRKDFIVDELQLLESRAAGASAALLIVRILTPKRLEELLTFSRSLALDVLVETHTRAEIDVALTAGADIVGVNCRDLDTFELDPDRAWKLITAIPPDRLTVAESAMHTRADVEKAARAGADAVLVGTALSSAADPSALTRDLASVPRAAR